MDAWIAGGIFFVAYLLIASERVDRTLVALLAGFAAVALGVIDQHEAFAAIDLNVIFLLAGMMVIASVLGSTGLFDWLAIRAVRLSHGHPIRLLVLLSVLTAILSAFLDNVTTVVLMTPVLLSIADRLGVTPKPYLVAAILASNVGGTATLIGDPPNLMIGSAAGLSFTDFLVELGPIAALALVTTIAIVVVFYRGHLQVPDERREVALELTETGAITNRPLLARGLGVLALVVVGFLVHEALGLEAATVALLGAAALLLVARVDPHEAFREIEWSTLFFFVGLFVLVEAVVKVGIVGGVADRLATAAGGDGGLATIALLWLSAALSAVVDNIPYTATAIPVVRQFIADGMAAAPLWWALALGACLGGNLTIVGASANVVVAGLADRAGHRIGFVEFFKIGLPVVAASLAISTAALWLRFLA